MSFHIERTIDGRAHRSGTFDSRGEAILAALATKDAPVLVVEDDDSVSPGNGTVVSAVLKRGEILNASAEPTWWSSVSESTRQALLHSGVLSERVVTDITHAGGAVGATQWVSGPMSQWELVPSTDHDWVRFEAARRAVRG
jgi:hypothetical protein